jgi:hypothetical protein
MTLSNLPGLLGLLLIGVIGFVLSVWALRKTRGFRHSLYEAESEGRKTLYWFSAIPGLILSVLLVVPLVLAAVFLAGAGASVSQASARYETREQIRRAVRDGVDDSLR